jgi:hypothetical protein
MSIATLKKKTQARYNNNSVGFSQFSLNGTHRNQGYVGQDTLGRSLPRTLAKGNTLRGYGGCCGTYHITPSILSGITSTEDNHVVKPSVLDNNGMIATKYRWIRRPAPFSVVKPPRTQNHIQYLATTTVKEIDACNKDIVKDTVLCKSCPALPASARGSLYNKYGVTITKPTTSFTSICYTQYLNSLEKKCLDTYVHSIQNVNTKFPLKATQGTPLPSGSNSLP